MRAGLFYFLALLAVSFGATEEIRTKFKNVALGKPAKQSSKLFRTSGSPEKANDGDIRSGSTDSCARTNREDDPWWRVDFGETVTVGSVRVYAQIDEGQNFALTADIYLGAFESWEFNYRCATVKLNVGVKTDRECLGSGRYLFIVAKGNDKAMSLCEVEVTPIGPQGLKFIDATIGEPFDVVLEGYVLFENDRIRIVDKDTSCGNVNAVTTSRLLNHTIPGTRSTGTSRSERWTGMIITHVGLYKICWCGGHTSVSACGAGEDFPYVVGFVVAIGKLGYVATLHDDENTPTVPTGIAAFGGYVYWTEPHRVQRINLVTFVRDTIAGSQDSGFCPDQICKANGNATLARFQSPSGLSMNGDGTKLYVADTLNHAVREIKLNVHPPTIRTVAGTGLPGYDEQTVATLARLFRPTGVFVDKNHNLFIGDTGNHLVRSVNLREGTATTGKIVLVGGVPGSLGDGVSGRPSLEENLKGPRQVSARYGFNGKIASVGFAGDAEVQQVGFSQNEYHGRLDRIAGNGNPGYSMDYGELGALSSAVNEPEGFLFDDDIAFISDTQNHRIFMVPIPNTIALGCWNENVEQPLIPLIEDHEEARDYLTGTAVLVANGFSSRSDAFRKCLMAAMALGYDIVALRDGGKCASSTNGAYVYTDLGIAEEGKDCFRGVGGRSANNVYKISNKRVPVDVAYRPFTIIGRGFYSRNTAPKSGNLPYNMKFPSDAWMSEVNTPKQIFMDTNNNLFFADSGNHQIRMMFGYVGPETNHSFTCVNRNPCTLDIRGNALWSNDRIAFVQEDQQCGFGSFNKEFPGVTIKASDLERMHTFQFRTKRFNIPTLELSQSGVYRICYCTFINLVNRVESELNTEFAINCGSDDPRQFAYTAGTVTISGPNALQETRASVGSLFDLYIFGNGLSDNDRIIVIDGAFECGSANLTLQPSAPIINVGTARAKGDAVYSVWTGLTITSVGKFVVCWCNNGDAGCVAPNNFVIQAAGILVHGAVPSSEGVARTAGGPFSFTVKGSGLALGNRLRFVWGNACGCTSCVTQAWNYAPCKLAMSEETWCDVVLSQQTEPNEVLVCWCGNNCDNVANFHQIIQTITLSGVHTQDALPALSVSLPSIPLGCAKDFRTVHANDGSSLLVSVTLVTRFIRLAGVGNSRSTISVTICAARDVCLPSVTFLSSALQAHSDVSAALPMTPAPQIPFEVRFVEVRYNTDSPSVGESGEAWLGDRVIVIINGVVRAFPLWEQLLLPTTFISLRDVRYFVPWMRSIIAPPWPMKHPTRRIQVWGDVCGGCPLGFTCAERMKTREEVAEWTGQACDALTSPTTAWECAPVCGDGIAVGREECDDGNTVANDGCSSLCKVENGFSCERESGYCEPMLCGSTLPLHYDAALDGRPCVVSDTPINETVMCHDLTQACDRNGVGIVQLYCHAAQMLSTSWACQKVDNRPRALSAAFVYGGTALTVMFDAPLHITTAFGSPTPCGAIFTTASMLRIGPSALCTWTSYVSLFVVLGKEPPSPIRWQDETQYSVGILDSALSHRGIPATAAPRQWEFPFHLIYIREALPQTPVVELRASRVIGRCSPVTWDVSFSTGRAGRPWVKAEWQCTDNQKICSIIQPWLNEKTLEVVALNVTIPLTLLARLIPLSRTSMPETITLRVRLTNAQGITGSAMQQVLFTQHAKIPSAVPLVPQTQQLKVGHPLHLEILTAQSFSSVCNDDAATWDGIEVEWRVDDDVVKSLSTIKRHLLLAPIATASTGDMLTVSAFVYHASQAETDTPRNEVRFTIEIIADPDILPRIRAPLRVHAGCSFAIDAVTANGTFVKATPEATWETTETLSPLNENPWQHPGVRSPTMLGVVFQTPQTHVLVHVVANDSSVLPLRWLRPLPQGEIYMLHAVDDAVVQMHAVIDNPDCAPKTMYGGFLLVGRCPETGRVAVRRSLIAPAFINKSTFQANVTQTDLSWGLAYTFQFVSTRSLDVLKREWAKLGVEQEFTSNGAKRNAIGRTIHFASTLDVIDSSSFVRSLSPFWGQFAVTHDATMSTVTLTVAWDYCVRCSYSFFMTLNDTAQVEHVLYVDSPSPHFTASVSPNSYTFRVSTTDFWGNAVNLTDQLVIATPDTALPLEDTLDNVESALLDVRSAQVPEASVRLVGQLAEQIHTADKVGWQASSSTRQNIATLLARMATVLAEAISSMSYVNYPTACEEYVLVDPLDNSTLACKRYALSTVDAAGYALMRIATSPAELQSDSMRSEMLSAVEHFVARCVLVKCELGTDIEVSHRYAIEYFLTVCNTAVGQQHAPEAGMHCARRLGDALAVSRTARGGRRLAQARPHIVRTDALNQVVLGVSSYSRTTVVQTGITVNAPRHSSSTPMSYPTIRIAPFNVTCVTAVLVTIKWNANPYAAYSERNITRDLVVTNAYDVVVRSCNVPVAIAQTQVHLEMMVGNAVSDIDAIYGYGSMDPYQCLFFDKTTKRWSKENVQSVFVLGKTRYSAGNITDGAVSDAHVACDLDHLSTFVVELVPPPKFTTSFMPQEVYFFNLSAACVVGIAVLSSLCMLYAHSRDRRMGLYTGCLLPSLQKRLEVIFFTDIQPMTMQRYDGALQASARALRFDDVIALSQQIVCGYRSPHVKELQEMRHGTNTIRGSPVKQLQLPDPTNDTDRNYMVNLKIGGYRKNVTRNVAEARTPSDVSAAASFIGSPRSQGSPASPSRVFSCSPVSPKSVDVDEPALKLNLPVGWTSAMAGTQIIYRNMLTDTTQSETPECPATSYLTTDELRLHLEKLMAPTHGSRLQREQRLNQLMFNANNKISSGISSAPGHVLPGGVSDEPPPGRKFAGTHNAAVPLVESEVETGATQISPEDTAEPLLALRWVYWSTCTLFTHVLTRTHCILHCFTLAPHTSQKNRVIFFATDASTALLVCVVLCFTILDNIPPLITVRADSRGVADLFADEPFDGTHILYGILTWPLVSLVLYPLCARQALKRKTVYGVDPLADAFRKEKLLKWERAETIGVMTACVLCVLALLFTVALTTFLIPQRNASIAFKMWAVGFATWNGWHVLLAIVQTVILRCAATRQNVKVDMLLTMCPHMYAFHHVIEGPLSPSSILWYWELYYEEEKMLHQAHRHPQRSKDTKGDTSVDVALP